MQGTSLYILYLYYESSWYISYCSRWKSSPSYSLASCRSTYLANTDQMWSVVSRYLAMGHVIHPTWRLWLKHTYPYHDQPHDVQPRCMEDESGTCKHPQPYTVICWSLCGDLHLSLIMQSSKVLHVLPDLWLICATWWGEKIIVHPSTAITYTALRWPLGAACYCKNVATCNAMFLLGGAKLRMRISLDPASNYPGLIR